MSPRRIIGAALGLLIVAGAAGCGGSETDQSAAPTSTVTVGEKTKTVVQRARPASKPSEKQEESEAKPSSASDEIVVPNVVGKDHQLAQDTMQAAGLYALAEKDATGQDRVLLIDRNWTTVAQDPPAGTRVSPDTTITLSAKKDGE